VAFVASLKSVTAGAGKSFNIYEAAPLTTTLSDLGIEIEKRLHARA
jgi:hypothetical protein